MPAPMIAIVFAISFSLSGLQAGRQQPDAAVLIFGRP